MYIFIKRLDIIISRKAREIDRDVLFAGRFLLVKLNSGKPLINSIIDASKSYGVASKFFKEMVDDIELGTPMEEALERAYRGTPSDKFRRMLFQISNALKIGVDVSAPLEAILEEIAQEQLVEIQRYGKKLNSLTMFYMLSAIVLPSLGVTLFSVIASMVSFTADIKLFLGVLFFLIIIQLMFLSIFRSIRPNLNI
jgi:pilus assembly protein TadC